MRPEKDAVMKWFKPEPAPPDELELAEKLEPGDYEVYSERCNNIVTEGKEIFIRVGISAMLRSGDLICGLYTAQGDMVTAYCGTYLHAATAQLPIKYIMNNYVNNPSVGVNDGDVFYANDSGYGGIHNPDQIAMMPIFYKGELLAWSAAAVHQTETGATEPGGMPNMAPTRHYEGMKLPPIKVADNFRIRDDIMELMLSFISRAPRMQAVDVRARIAGCDRIRIRIQELAEEKGADFVRGLFRKMIMMAEEGARRKIARWNDGIYRDNIYLSIQGARTALSRISLSIRKEGDHIWLDFTGTSPENDTAYNAFPWAVAAHTTVYLYSYIFYDLPISCGIFAPIEYVVPEGTMLNPHPEASVCCAVLLCKSMFFLSALCFSRMIYASEDRAVCVAPNGSSSASSMAGINQFGVLFSDLLSSFTLNTVGQGARSNADGMDSALFPHCFVSHCNDTEEDEGKLPCFSLYRVYQLDGSGQGKYRGGCGTEGCYVLPYDTPYTNLIRSDHMGRIPFSQGLFGGYPPPALPELVIRNSNILELMEKNSEDIPMSLREIMINQKIKGDYKLVSGPEDSPHTLTSGGMYVATNSGGAGYGDSIEREPQSVVDDVKSGIVSDRTVQNIYHVAYDRDTWIVDYDKTEKLRAKEKQNRKQRGRPYHEFIKEWETKRPPEKFLEYFGSWPDAKKVREIIRV